VIRKALLAAVLFTAGCAQVHMADPQADQMGRSLAPPGPGRGALYVYRSGVMGFAQPIEVGIVGGPTAQLGSNNYFRFDGPPAAVQINCKVGNNTGGAQVQLPEGGIRYVEVSMKIGPLLPGCQVAEVAPDQGQAAVRSSRRVVAR